MPYAYDDELGRYWIPAHSEAWAVYKQNQRQKKYERRRLQEQLRRQKKHNALFEQNTNKLRHRVAKHLISVGVGNFDYLSQFVNDDLEMTEEEEGLVLNPIRCNACGLIGHMMTKKECPLNPN